MIKTHYTIGQFAEKLGISTQSLRYWEKQQKLNPAFKTPNGRRYYSVEQVDEFLEKHLTK